MQLEFSCYSYWKYIFLSFLIQPELLNSNCIHHPQMYSTPLVIYFNFSSRYSLTVQPVTSLKAIPLSNFLIECMSWSIIPQHLLRGYLDYKDADLISTSRRQSKMSEKLIYRSCLLSGISNPTTWKFKKKAVCLDNHHTRAVEGKTTGHVVSIDCT